MTDAVKRRIIKQLGRVEKLIKRGWTRGELARDAEGYVIEPKHDKAVCWCLVGALRKVSSDTEAAIQLCRQLSEDLPDRRHLSIFNDTCATKQPVIALVNRTIKRLRRELTA